MTMFNAVSSSGAYTDGTTGIYFAARREEKVTSNHYFVRVKNNDPYRKYRKKLWNTEWEFV